MLAVKIRCRKRRTSSSAVRQSIASQSRRSSPGPFTTAPATGGIAVCPDVMASNLSFGSGAVVSVSVQAHLTRVGTLSGPGIRPYPASYPARSAEGPTTYVPVSCCLSAAGIRFSGHPSPGRELGLPHGRLTGYEYESVAGPWRGYHVPHARATTGMGASSIPRATVLTWPTRDRRSTPVALPRPAPTTLLEQPISKARV